MDSPLQSPSDANAFGMPCVGVFDSGVGGLSVLRSLRIQMPQAPLMYVADSGHAPYGERGDAYVVARSHAIASHLVAQGAVGLVIACNTATAAAVRHLRRAWPSLPVIGVEPGLKPAAALTRNGRVGVMATPGTLASERFAALVRAQPAGLTVFAQPCPGLADLIEEGDLHAPALRSAIAEHTSALRAAGVDTVVLGCTHYAFAIRQIEEAMGPGVRIVDTADAVARHAARQLGGLLNEAAPNTVRLQTTGKAQRLRDITSAWLPFDCRVESLAA
ncbi:glutamate racemase [Piscinibacter sp.]|uniref:glutamate racemase n=1 Tax=Piscinibacter sp. TaxID=1903157 RepID=UPI002D7F8CE6|nr:glutamate racemase [Albitalea sp.]